MRTESGTSADYDFVGKYRQDEINGFDEDLIFRMIAYVDPARRKVVLDAMAGDGNLTERLFGYCNQQHISKPHVTVLDYSSVQVDFARRTLASFPADFVWGDMLTMSARDGSRVLEPGSFDAVMIKSGNHELPLEAQRTLYSNVFQLLAEGGRFVNLGFLFEDEEERDEFRRITRVKDSLAGLKSMVKQRHFLTRTEFDDALSAAGFSAVAKREPISYILRSNVAALHYFKPEKRIAYETLLQVAQIKARAMREHGRIVFGGTASTMYCPGEITVVEKPTAAEGLAATYKLYPYDLLRHIEVHRDLIGAIVDEVPRGGSVLDLGCGLGLLRERLPESIGAYMGIDISEDFLSTCKERFAKAPRTVFVEQDLNELELVNASFDLIALINVLYQPGINVQRVLRTALGALSPHGVVCVSGPSTPESFERIEPKIRAQLERDGLLPKMAAEFAQVRLANARLLSSTANYFSCEGMIRLLHEIGFTRIRTARTDIYYDTGFLVVAGKGDTEHYGTGQ